MRTAERLLEEAKGLPQEELAWLVEQLFECLEYGEDNRPPLSPAWEAELERRVEERDAGRGQTIPMDEARRRLGLRPRR